MCLFSCFCFTVQSSIEVLAAIRKIPVISLVTSYVCFRVIDMFGPNLPLVQIKITRFTSDENLQIERLFLVIKLFTYTYTPSLANYFLAFSFNMLFFSPPNVLSARFTTEM